VVGVILNLAAFFAWHTFWPQGTAEAPFAGTFDWFPLIVAVASFAALWKYKADIMKVIGVTALLGLAYTFVM
jgi:chromate transporter